MLLMINGGKQMNLDLTVGLMLSGKINNNNRITESNFDPFNEADIILIYNVYSFFINK